MPDLGSKTFQTGESRSLSCKYRIKSHLAPLLASANVALADALPARQAIVYPSLGFGCLAVSRWQPGLSWRFEGKSFMLDGQWPVQSTCRQGTRVDPGTLESITPHSRLVPSVQSRHPFCLYSWGMLPVLNLLLA